MKRKCWIRWIFEKKKKFRQIKLCIWKRIVLRIWLEWGIFTDLSGLMKPKGGGIERRVARAGAGPLGSGGGWGGGHAVPLTGGWPTRRAVGIYHRPSPTAVTNHKSQVTVIWPFPPPPPHTQIPMYVEWWHPGGYRKPLIKDWDVKSVKKGRIPLRRGCQIKVYYMRHWLLYVHRHLMIWHAVCALISSSPNFWK